jgi:hypothetical protein
MVEGHHNAWMNQARHGADLSGELAVNFVGERQFFGDDLHGDREVLSPVDSAPNLTHAAFGKRFDEIEGAEGNHDIQRPYITREMAFQKVRRSTRWVQSKLNIRLMAGMLRKQVIRQSHP